MTAEETLDAVIGFKTKSDVFKKDIIRAMETYASLKLKEQQWLSVETPPVLISAEHGFISVLITLNSGVVRQGWFNTKTNNFQTIGHDVYEKESITHYMITPQPPTNP